MGAFIICWKIVRPCKESHQLDLKYARNVKTHRPQSPYDHPIIGHRPMGGLCAISVDPPPSLFTARARTRTRCKADKPEHQNVSQKAISNVWTKFIYLGRNGRNSTHEARSQFLDESFQMTRSITYIFPASEEHSKNTVFEFRFYAFRNRFKSIFIFRKPLEGRRYPNKKDQK